jgi:mannitol-1-phosphate 5-dehydrogenase
MLGKTAVVFGAGKIARGFLAHLLTLSGYRITFIEKSAELIKLLRERKRYKVHIMGAPEKNIIIEGFEVIAADDLAAVAEEVSSGSVAFISVGGPNLPQIVPLLAAGIRRASAEGRRDPLNVIICENYFQPAQLLRKLLAEQLSANESEWALSRLGFVETMVLRSAIEPTEEMKAEDPLSLKSQDLWELPADREAFVGEIPPIRGLAPRENFQGALTRKVFTYNATNALIAYTGYLKGYKLLSEAANDPEIAELARAASLESGEAICKRFGFTPEDQHAFAESALAKYQRSEIVDPIERNARDPLRKLSRNDRLVGPACLAQEYGTEPVTLCRAIGAALHYDNPADPAAQKLQTMIRMQRLPYILENVCGIDASSRLGTLIQDAYRGWGKK